MCAMPERPLPKCLFQWKGHAELTPASSGKATKGGGKLRDKQLGSFLPLENVALYVICVPPAEAKPLSFLNLCWPEGLVHKNSPRCTFELDPDERKHMAVVWLQG